MILTYKQFMSLALKHYAHGGDGVYECWDEESFRVYCAEFGPMTEEKALALFATYCGVCEDMENW